MPEVPVRRDYLPGRQPVLDHELAGSWPVGGLVLARKARRILRHGQDFGEVLFHGVWDAGQEVALELTGRGVVVVDLCSWLRS